MPSQKPLSERRTQTSARTDIAYKKTGHVVRPIYDPAAPLGGFGQPDPPVVGQMDFAFGALNRKGKLVKNVGTGKFEYNGVKATAKVHSVTAAPGMFGGTSHQVAASGTHINIAKAKSLGQHFAPGVPSDTNYVMHVQSNRLPGVEDQYDHSHRQLRPGGKAVKKMAEQFAARKSGGVTRRSKPRAAKKK
jgi:hypothetical protein